MALFRFIGKYILLLSVPAVLLLFYNQAANWHYHILNDGTAIKHAHPYNSDAQGKTPFQNHQHSHLELLVLSQLSNILAVLVILLLVAGILQHFNRQQKALTEFVWLKPAFLLTLTDRGPPTPIS
jgi:uncharacterized iron-regulated membrane protein